MQVLAVSLGIARRCKPLPVLREVCHDLGSINWRAVKGRDVVIDRRIIDLGLAPNLSLLVGNISWVRRISLLAESKKQVRGLQPIELVVVFVIFDTPMYLKILVS